jgi:hypothetical protein
MKRKECRAASSIEYAILVTALLLALFFARNYLIRGLAGTWKAAGDTFGFGRQYDPRPFGTEGKDGGTLRCYFEPRTGQWLDRDYVKAACDCTLPPEHPQYGARCLACLNSAPARNPYCRVE